MVCNKWPNGSLSLLSRVISFSDCYLICLELANLLIRAKLQTYCDHLLNAVFTHWKLKQKSYTRLSHAFLKTQNTAAPGWVLNHAPDVRSLFFSYRDSKLIFSSILHQGFSFFSDILPSKQLSRFSSLTALWLHVLVGLVLIQMVNNAKQTYHPLCILKLGSLAAGSLGSQNDTECKGFSAWKSLNDIIWVCLLKNKQEKKQTKTRVNWCKIPVFNLNFSLVESFPNSFTLNKNTPISNEKSPTQVFPQDFLGEFKAVPGQCSHINCFPCYNMDGVCRENRVKIGKCKMHVIWEISDLLGRIFMCFLLTWLGEKNKTSAVSRIFVPLKIHMVALERLLEKWNVVV